jgi:hypothetical protein
MRHELDRIHWGDIVVLGRILALVIIVLGAALALWAFPDDRDPSQYVLAHTAQRNLLRQVLYFTWYGSLVLIVTEIISALRGGDSGTIDWQIPQLTVVIAGVLIVSGTALTIWDIFALHDVYESGWQFLDIFSSDPGRTVSDDIRYFLEAELQTYLWQGGLLFLLAVLASRVGWRAEGELPEEEEGSIVVTEP